ncbi:hypothetical protein QJS10_CPB14g00681 [Acorus calamus]|uniref:Uncharacterized protein n=1 Tax=Acorus calamus TaxID=4465 RepID=A0AAV9DDD8_ACOCL|nr:hypothetical protein QJS10_CPB14g00681 [Acorus calamus]
MTPPPLYPPSSPTPSQTRPLSPSSPPTKNSSARSPPLPLPTSVTPPPPPPSRPFLFDKITCLGGLKVLEQQSRKGTQEMQDGLLSLKCLSFSTLVCDIASQFFV